MFDDFKNRYSCRLKARNQERDLIEFQFFSQYKPEEHAQKIVDIWTYDLIRLEDYPQPIRFLWGNQSFLHSVSKKEYSIIYGEEN
ncbi:hypothetical protein [Acinetobacter pittii]|uniref:hypothetical protein n=1 Tax=Acinetobacter pittii TaxID=48296 RepID=UPI00300D21DD